MMINSLGLLEVSGLVAGIEAADAMVKAANVRILSYELVSPGLVTLVVEGDLAACRAALDAGACAAERLGHVISQKEIGRPDSDTEWLVTEGLTTQNVTPSLPLSSSPLSSRASSAASATACSSSLRDAAIGKQIVDGSISAPWLSANRSSSEAATLASQADKSDQQQNGVVDDDVVILSVQTLLQELQRDNHGMTASEVAAHFDCSNEIARKRLDALWRAGILRKRHSRYRCKPIHEPVEGEIVSDQSISDSQEKQ